MCGIAGILSWRQPPREDSVQAMLVPLRHRGPDGEGSWCDGPIALGHRRLAVIDTHGRASQPMADGTGNVIVFNGEIYNFRELGDELAAQGVAFHTTSDTEVILAGYRRWGREVVERLDGMFAFALWDSGRQELLLARDRLGEKPLFLWRMPDGGLAFASEMKALRRLPGAPSAIDAVALDQYLACGYVVAPATIIQGIAKLPPAHLLVAERRQVGEPRPYWSVLPAFRRKRTFRDGAEAAEALAEQVDRSVRSRLVSDVPLGAFLSGGIDSAAVVSAIVADGTPLDTFSAGFDHASFDERGSARAMADWLGTRHHDCVVAADAWSQLPRIMWYMDEPLADSSIIPTFCLAAFARRSVTVAVTGDGGDEVFAGYETYRADKLHQWTSRLPAILPRMGLGLLDLLPSGRGKVGLDFKLRQFLAAHGEDAAGAHFSWRRLFRRAECLELLQPDLGAVVDGADAAAPFRAAAAEAADLHLVDRMTYVDMRTWLADDILVKVDRATMAHGLESRAPFLDHRLVEFAAALPPEYKMAGMKLKQVLKESQRARLPAETLRRRKAGFNAPVAHWMARPDAGLFAGITPAELAGEWFEPGVVKRLCQEHWSGRRDHSWKLFALLALHHWSQASGDAP